MVKELEAKVNELLGDSYKLSFDDGNSLELEFWSPAGEDCLVDLNGKTLRGLADDAKKTYEAFDSEEHAAQIYHARHYGSKNDRRFYAGAPERLNDLLEDAKSIKESYRDIWKKLEAAANAETAT